MTSVALYKYKSDRGDCIQSDARADILVAAAHCFKENGFSATSIDDVARELGATKGRIYHHFRSKTDLFFEVYRRGMEINFEASLPEANGAYDPLTKLTRMGMAHAVTLMSQQHFQRVLAQGVAMHQSGATTAAQRETLVELINVRNDYEALFRTAIENAARHQGLILSDPSIASKSFLAVLNSTVFWYSPLGEDVHEEQLAIARELVTYALRGLNMDAPQDAYDNKGETDE